MNMNELLPDEEIIMDALKINRGQKCRRAACQQPFAVCKHSQTGEYYCVRCARWINELNSDVPNLVVIPNFKEILGI